MRKIFIVGILSFAIALPGCASKWHAAYGVQAWTEKNVLSLHDWYAKGSAEEKAFLRANIHPPMDIMKHACSAIDAIDEGDDMKLGKEIQTITNLGIGWGKTFPKLIQALKEKDVEKAAGQLEGIQIYVQEQAGIIQIEEEKGWIRRTWDKIW